MFSIKQKFQDFRRETRQPGKPQGNVVSIKDGQVIQPPRFLGPEQQKKNAIQKLAIAFERKGWKLGYLSVIADEAFLNGLEEKQREEVKKLIDPKVRESLQAALPEQIEDIARCVEELNEAEHASLLLSLFCEHFEEGIIWLPFVKREILPYTAESGTTLLFAGDEKIDNYISRFRDYAVSFLEAERRLGISRMVSIFSGLPLVVEIAHEEGFCTVPNGTVYLPSVCWHHDDKKFNLSDYEQGTLHELSHHRYRSFRVNLHPEAFDYSSSGFSFVKAIEKEGVPCVVVEKDGKEYEITRIEHIYALFEKPGILKHVWNILEDRRIDLQHVKEFPGSKELYEGGNARALGLRKEITDDPNGAFEAFLQVALCGGKTKTPIPPSVNKILEPVWAALGKQDLGAADATDSLGVAMEISAIFSKIMEDMEGEYKGKGGKSTTDASKGTVVVEMPKRHAEEDEEAEGETIEGAGSGGKPGNKPGEGTPNGSGKRGRKDFNYDSHSTKGKVRGGWQVNEIVPAGWSEVAVPKTIERRIERAFRKFAPKDGLLVSGQDSGDPDMELMAEHRRLERTGMRIPPQYFSDVLHIKRSVLMGLLVDFSSSMEEDRRGDITKLDASLRAAKALEGGAALLHDDVITYGFGGGDPVQMCALGWPGSRIKKPLKFSGATPLGGAIRHMEARMQEWRRIHSKKLAHMLVITDGQPNMFAGDSTSGNSDDEAVFDCSQAVSDARERGIKVFGIIVLGEGEDEGRFRADYDKIFGRGNYFIMKSIEALPSFLERYYKARLLKQGER